MHLRIPGVALIGAAALLLQSPHPAVAAGGIPGAIFTTDATGSEVNENVYAAKSDVYLDGGPGLNAPQTAAGLDDGVYVFMVTDPSGKKLLSTDAAGCRQFTVAGGIIVNVTPAGACAHTTGIDQDHGAQGAITVQLIPFNDTPNPGGEYKAWATPAVDFPSGCLATVDCAAGKHGFTPSFSKTDNFKVKQKNIREIDTQFFNDLNG